MPALALIIASLTKCNASSWPLTRIFKLSSKCSNLSFSLLASLLTGIFVHLETILAIDSSSTTSLNIAFLSSNFKSASSFSSLGIVPCCNLATVSKSYLASAYSSSRLAFSISSFSYLLNY